MRLDLHTLVPDGAGLERSQRLGRLPSKRADEAAVVLVRDLADAMIELELLEGGEGAVARLSELEAAPVELVRLLEDVPIGPRLSQVGQCDEDHTSRGEQRPEDQRQAHCLAGASAAS